MQVDPDLVAQGAVLQPGPQAIAVAAPVHGRLQAAKPRGGVHPVPLLAVERSRVARGIRSPRPSCPAGLDA
jgi:hypothetical protein